MFSRDNNSLPGVILLAHGSSESEAGEEMDDLCGKLGAAKPAWRFTTAFLNHEPKLDRALEFLISEGCDSVRVLPLLVFKGKHTLVDIPAHIQVLRSKHPGLPIDLEQHLSRLPGFREVLLQALENASALSSNISKKR